MTAPYWNPAPIICSKFEEETKSRKLKDYEYSGQSLIDKIKEGIMEEIK